MCTLGLGRVGGGGGKGTVKRDTTRKEGTSLRGECGNIKGVVSSKSHIRGEGGVVPGLAAVGGGGDQG